MSSSSGGIVRSGTPGPGRDNAAFRRRWPSGVTIVTCATTNGYRGITVSAVMPVSEDVPRCAFAIRSDSAFRELIHPAQLVGLSILDRSAEFIAERFAGRAPVPDAAFTGIPFELVEGVPLLLATSATAIVALEDILERDDHLLIMGTLVNVLFASDAEDPLIHYEGQYRELEFR